MKHREGFRLGLCEYSRRFRCRDPCYHLEMQMLKCDQYARVYPTLNFFAGQTAPLQLAGFAPHSELETRPKLELQEGTRWR